MPHCGRKAVQHTSFHSRKCTTLLIADTSNPLKTFLGSLPASHRLGGDTKHAALAKGMLISTSHRHLQGTGGWGLQARGPCKATIQLPTHLYSEICQ